VARAEACLVGQTITADLIAEAAAIVAADITPVDDARGSADYRRHIVGVVARRGLAQLFGLTQEQP
jgi:carbon-monoxide dehydrogenase medium subunit